MTQIYKPERKKAEVYLEYQPYIDFMPVQPDVLYKQACSNDTVTVNSWRDTWIKQTQANHAVYGPFKNRSLGQLHNAQQHKPMFVVGSGPSLKKNAHLLAGDHGIPIISCLHNFHFLEDLGVKVDYYVSLDSGPVTIEEISEGGNPDTDYFDKTRGKTLLCYVGTHPNLLAKWKGDIYFFNCPVPDQNVEAEIDKIEKFKCLVSSGGNVLGACLYIAKSFLGARTTIFLGADFSFSYQEKFHGWNSKYDAGLGNYIRMTDIYGNKTKTWQSYANFKAWFDWVSIKVPGEYINCTEGGTFGAYNEGNLRSIKQMDLAECLDHFSLSRHTADQSKDPENCTTTILF